MDTFCKFPTLCSNKLWNFSSIRIFASFTTYIKAKEFRNKLSSEGLHPSKISNVKPANSHKDKFRFLDVYQNVSIQKTRRLVLVFHRCKIEKIKDQIKLFFMVNVAGKSSGFYCGKIPVSYLFKVCVDPPVECIRVGSISKLQHLVFNWHYFLFLSQECYLLYVKT